MDEKIRGKSIKGKVRFDLIGATFERTVAQILTEATGTYQEGSWREVNPQHYIAALRRHINRLQEGLETGDKSKICDSKSGHHHAAHAACNAMFLFYLMVPQLSGVNFRQTELAGATGLAGISKLSNTPHDRDCLISLYPNAYCTCKFKD